MSEEPKGWGPSINSHKWHYFVGGKSLCGRFAWIGRYGNLKDSNHDSPDNCAPCKRKRAKRYPEPTGETE